MAKYFGAIGYAEQEETAPDVWQEKIVEREYFGDVTRNQKSWDQGDGLNDDLNIDNVLSIVADPYAYNHFHTIRYVTWMGAKWKVKRVEVQRPRLLLYVGGVYNDQEPGTAEPDTPLD